MEIIHSVTAGTLESSDIMITIEKRNSGGIEIDLKSSVMQQFGEQIKNVILGAVTDMGVENIYINAVDKGALDCTIKARVLTAIYRAAESKEYIWN